MKTYTKEKWKAYTNKILLKYAIKDEQDFLREELGKDWRDKVQEFIETKEGQKWLKKYKKFKEDI